MIATERFDAKLTRSPEGCLIYGGATQNGYGVFNVGGKAVKAHRYAYEQVNGPIPEGMTLDHECHNKSLARGECAPGPCRHRACCDPGHLIVRGMWDNTRMGGAFTAAHSRKTHCPQDHEYDGVNARGERICHRCQYAATKRYRSKRKLAATMVIVRDEPEE